MWKYKYVHHIYIHQNIIHNLNGNKVNMHVIAVYAFR